MRPLAFVMIFVFALGSAAPALAQDNAVEFSTFIGLPVAGMVINNVPGGGIPWRITRGEAKLSPDGTLTAEVEGLVFDAGPNEGRNTVAQFMAVVSCITSAGLIVNTNSTPVPATIPGGEANFHEQLALPDPCMGPVVFVGAPAQDGFPNGRWFAVSGF